MSEKLLHAGKSTELRARKPVELFLAAVVALVLAFLLILRTPLIAKGAYQIGFFAGLAAFGAILFMPASQWDARMMRHIPTRFSLIVFIFVAMAPYLLLFESGIAGYRGFSSWLRYASLVPTVLGGGGLAAALLLRLFRR